MAFLPDVVAPFWRPVMAMGFDVTPAYAQSRETGTRLMEDSDGELGFAAWLNCSGAKPEGTLRPAPARRQRYIQSNIAPAIAANSGHDGNCEAIVDRLAGLSNGSGRNVAAWKITSGKRAVPAAW
jgi:hypothetical protein